MQSFHRFLAFSLITLLLGCTGKSCAKKEVAALPDTFVWALYTEPKAFDPGLSEDAYGTFVLNQLFEGLANYHPETLKPIPGVATHWEVSPDGITYTFYLRSDAKWSNGDPVTAHDFEYAWKRALDPKTASRYAWIMFFIKNSEEFNSGTLTDPNSVGVKAINDTTLVVTLKNPTPFFPEVVCFTTFYPVHQKTVETYGENWTRAENMVSNGAYKLVDWQPNQHFLLEKDPLYWDAANVSIPKVKFLTIEDRETALKLYEEGVVHYIEEIPEVKMPLFRDRPDFYNTPYLTTFLLLINTTKKPFDDKRVRQALNMALDKKQITDVFQKGDFPATHLTPKGMLGYIPPEGKSYDPEGARALLTEAGYSDPKTFPKFTLAYSSGTQYQKIAEMAQNFWKTNLGIDIELLSYEWKVLVQNYEKGNYDVGRMNWVGDYMDPQTFLGFFTAPEVHHTGWINPQYDALVNEIAAAELDPQKRFALLQEAEKIFLDEMPAIPVYHHSRPILVDSRVTGFYPNLQQLHPLKFAAFKNPNEDVGKK